MVDFQFHSFATSSNSLVAGKLLTVASVGIFAGTALSFSSIIIPSFRKFSSASSLAIWHESIKSAQILQTASNAVGVIGGIGLYYETENPFYLYSAITLATVVPLSLFLNYRVNKKLIEIRQDNTVDGKADSMRDNKFNDAEIEMLLRRWNLLNIGRTVLGYGALLAALYGVASDSGVRFIFSA
ncbi:hypothetical protein BX616_006878 [Lobosporangium transversale]|uniref:DUF1772-domain-containing protein n=1 Tax=Lobosporangium transversale TaxID=64571 RepID=A0A1Y2GNL4_9FUNG|nr:hypothetical protein BCR41DRAFT_354388 [Lobosporangium transversale]KAF9915099.1 hypothetical protein BX616_006878 [Lobosporangium transversale]ORZ14957.1 hypothetical protein BCR41DRAFT_354388 [Lobosporangium transversale]|eukprot:XP_021881089.1 hypothetical protein BCR41DRAFT_354388 [Lobosporangium transversale]